jgi:hypothetical protein
MGLAREASRQPPGAFLPAPSRFSLFSKDAASRKSAQVTSFYSHDFLAERAIPRSS